MASRARRLADWSSTRRMLALSSITGTGYLPIPLNLDYTEKFSDSIVAVLGCHERVIFKGYLLFGGDGHLNSWVDGTLRGSGTCDDQQPDQRKGQPEDFHEHLFG